MTIISQPYTYLGAVVLPLGLALMTWAAMLIRKAGISFQLQGQEMACLSTGSLLIISFGAAGAIYQLAQWVGLGG